VRESYAVREIRPAFRDAVGNCRYETSEAKRSVDATEGERSAGTGEGVLYPVG
jgi:hypothetical protein